MSIYKQLTDSKYTSIITSLYDGFNRIAAKRISESQGRQLLRQAEDLFRLREENPQLYERIAKTQRDNPEIRFSVTDFDEEGNLKVQEEKKQTVDEQGNIKTEEGTPSTRPTSIVTQEKTSESSLSINTIANESRGETKVVDTKSQKVGKDNVKNYFKNIESKGRRSNKAFTTVDIFVNNTYLGDKPKIVIEDTPSGKLFKRKNIRRRIKLSKKKVTQPVNQK